jgi:hypothetical protein
MHIRRHDIQLDENDYLFISEDFTDYEWISEKTEVAKGRYPYDFPNVIFVNYIVSELNLYSRADYEYEAYEELSQEFVEKAKFNINKKEGRIMEEDRQVILAFNEFFKCTDMDRDAFVSRKSAVSALANYVEACRVISATPDEMAFHLQNTIAGIDD